MKLIINRDRAF